jgi:hypothetical protein
MSLAELGGAVEISEDRTRVWVGVAGYAGDMPRVELLTTPREVTPAAAAGWVDEVTDRYHVDPWVVDPASPAGSLLLQLAGLNILQPAARDVAAACGVFLDLVVAGGVKAARNPELRESVQGAQARRLAGGLAWDRQAAVPAGPTLAVSLALWGATNYQGLGPEDVTIAYERSDPTKLPAHLAAQAEAIASGFPPELPHRHLPLQFVDLGDSGRGLLMVIQLTLFRGDLPHRRTPRPRLRPAQHLCRFPFTAGLDRVLPVHRDGHLLEQLRPRPRRIAEPLQLGDPLNLSVRLLLSRESGTPPVLLSLTLRLTFDDRPALSRHRGVLH